MYTNDLTKTYEALVIDKAKRDYLETFKSIFPKKSHYTSLNISISHRPGYNSFTLHMCDSHGTIVHEESFCFSDF
jgi:hypothetical protein